MDSGKLTIRGQDAQVKWSYHLAATLGSWTITGDPTGLSVTAQVIDADTFKLEQRPLTFVVSRPTGAIWRWPVQSLQFADTMLTASLGPQE